MAHAGDTAPCAHTEDRLVYTALDRDEGREVQYILKERLKLSSGMIKVLKYNEGILLDGAVVRGTATVRAGQNVTALLNCRQNISDIKPEPYPLDIIYEDDAVIVINKPADTVMHPTFRHQTGTLTNYVLYHLQQKGIYSDVHIAGRLDKDTTGIAIIARNAYVQESLKLSAEKGGFEKRYIAAVLPPPPSIKGTIDAPIARDSESIIKRKISPDGAPAVTHYNVLYTDAAENYAIVEFVLETGRTHQIRVHTSYMGFPIIGDTLYGSRDADCKNGLMPPHQLLHAWTVSLTHPVTGKKFIFRALPPDEWGKYLLPVNELARTWPLRNSHTAWESYL